MSCFYTEKIPENNQVVIEGDEAHHILNVRRAKIGDSLDLFDANGTRYQANILSTSKKKVFCSILSQQNFVSSFPIEFYLIQGLTKSKVWDIILQKAMELGLENLIPIVTDYTAAGANSSGKMERWKKVVLGAAKQSERPFLMNITPTYSFEDVWTKIPNNTCVFIAHTGENLPHLKNILDLDVHKKIKQIAIMIGPEGGWSEKELQTAQKNNATFFSLGGNILRAETAAIATISNIYFYFAGRNISCGI